MSIVLEAIKFNHDSSSATHDALNVRRNATQFVTVPEWRRGISNSPEDSPAAYAIRETLGNEITIQARFRCTDPGISQAEIRAVDGSPLLLWPEATRRSFACRILHWLCRKCPRVANVLGEVRMRRVTFPASGDTDYLTFSLKKVRLSRAGVGARPIYWRWQYRLSRFDRWVDFAFTTHRVYSVLEEPRSPWQQQPYAEANAQLLWTDVLDYACRWGFLTTTADQAAADITRGVYQLGGSILAYNPGSYYTHLPAPGTFDCTAFLDLLRGGEGNGSYVNCVDCATIVTSFANALGCTLGRWHMGDPVNIIFEFATNQVILIGSDVWQDSYEAGFDYFLFHKLASPGEGSVDDEIYDACLQVDGDSDPIAVPHTATLPTGMRYGEPGDLGYRHRLVRPIDSPRVVPVSGGEREFPIV